MRMQVAVACIKVASQAVSCMPSILFFPILPFLMVVCLVIYWICVAGYLYSAGTITPTYKDTSSATLLSISVSLSRLLHAMRRSGCEGSNFPDRHCAMPKPLPRRQSRPLQALFDNSSGTAPPPPPPPAANSTTNFTDAECANNPNCYYAIDWDKKLEYLFIYHFFGLLWTNQFIIGFG